MTKLKYQHKMREHDFNNIKVYKTNVAEKSKAGEILDKIRLFIPDSDPSFDLEDCDKVLRVETQKKPVDDMKIRGLVQASGYQIEELP